VTTTPQTPPPAGGATAPERIRTALTAYRVMAWATGIWLIALCYEMFVRYVLEVDNPPTWIGVVHGWVYFVYLIATSNLAVKVRWPVAKTISTLLAGTIPLLGIILERVRTQEVKDRFGW
jgi:integral membrane protein